LLVDPIFASSNPAEGHGFFKGYKIYSSLCFEEEVKPWASCRKIFDMLKNPSKYEQKKSFPSAVPSAVLLDDCAGRIGREQWCTNQESYLVDIIPP
jgi:hypothetical protein